MATGINMNLSGKDTANRSINSDSFNNWSGTFSASRRDVTNATDDIPNCAGATIFIDMRLVLIRGRDGYRMQEGATFGYDDDYKPVCGLLLDGHFWIWTLAQPLPLDAEINGNLFMLSGKVFSTPNMTGATTPLNGMVALDPDTADSANLTFVYKVPSQPGLAFQVLGETSEFRFRIDPVGNLLGFQYLRTGSLPSPNGLTEPVTLTMTSE